MHIWVSKQLFSLLVVSNQPNPKNNWILSMMLMTTRYNKTYPKNKNWNAFIVCWIFCILVVWIWPNHIVSCVFFFMCLINYNVSFSLSHGFTEPVESNNWQGWLSELAIWSSIMLLFSIYGKINWIHLDVVILLIIN